ncbi:MAG: adenylyltransferase/cytidyltransferase family protein [Halobacteriales archaeon]
MTADERTVVAQGTFDILHPGHVHYLEESAALGDRLEVIVSRRSNVDHKRPPILPATQRRDVVAALAAVDAARVGHPEDIFVPIEDIRPDVITLGFDQHHDPEAIAAELAHRGIDCEVVRVGARPTEAGAIYSTSDIVERILERYG